MVLRADDAGIVVLDRCDRGEIVGLDSLDSPERRRDGTIVYTGVLARTGVLVYRGADGGTRRELVTLDTLRSMVQTTKYSSVTNEHPRDASGVAVDVTRETAKDLAVGHVGDDVELVETGDGEGYIRIRFVVDDPDTIDQVNDKTLVELSPKYQCEYRAVAGEHPVHGEYDGVQLSRDVNAVALTRRGRGSAVFVRADSAYQEILMSTTRKDRADEESAATGIMSEELITALASKIAEKIAALIQPAEEAPAEEASDTEEEVEVKAEEASDTEEEVEVKAEEASDTEEEVEAKAEEEVEVKESADSAFLAAFARRSRILDAAQRHGVSVTDADQRLGNDDLLARVARQALPQDLHARADSDPAFAEGALCTHTMIDRRHDGLGVVHRADAADDYEDPWERGLKTRRRTR